MPRPIQAILMMLMLCLSCDSFAATLSRPQIKSFSPKSGPVNTVISVSGKGFSGANAAWVGNTRSTSLTVLSDTQARITVPAGAKSGQLAIINSRFSGYSGSAFTVTTTTTTPAPVPTPDPLPSTALSLRVQGRNLIDGNGNVVQLRGVNYSGFEFTAIQGWSPADPSGAQAGQSGGPKWSALKSWKSNSVRVPLNEASWLGYDCVDTSGVTRDPDPGDNYKASVKALVDQATAEGLYVILDLHWTAPGNTCPMLQTQMANSDHSIDFWTSVATLFKSYPSVVFELFNEPYMDTEFSGDTWSAMMQGTGGSFSGYPATSNTGAWKIIQQPWAIASYQAMIDAVRATGATNVVLVGTLSYAQDLSGWLSHKPNDPLKQMAAALHPYRKYNSAWDYPYPNYYPQVLDDAKAILAAGIPLVMSEVGGRSATGTVGSPIVTTMTNFADANGASVIGWCWDLWNDTENVLIKDVDGNPTDGYGQVLRSWMLAH